MSIYRAIFVLLICFTLQNVAAIRFYLEPGEKRCFTEELQPNSRITGETRITGGKDEMDIDVWITTMQGKVLYHKRAAEHGRFSFQTPIVHDHHDDIDDIDDDYDYGDEQDIDEDEDTYKICIEHQHTGAHSPSARRSVFFVLHETFGNMPDNTERAAKATDTDRLQTTMRAMHTTLSGMIGDLSQLQRRERALTKRMKRTLSRVTTFAVLSLIVTLCTSALQYKYYKGYFKQKKLC